MIFFTDFTPLSHHKQEPGLHFNVGSGSVLLKGDSGISGRVLDRFVAYSYFTCPHDL